jgi:small-conductance mechanosensitive channel/CRP-like cAMP-binding protein
VEPFFGPGRSDRSVDIVGIAIAVALLLLARWLLPPGDKSRARQPAIFLLLAGLFAAAGYAVGRDAGLSRILLFFYTFFLLASCGRSVVLLTVDVIFGRRTHRAPPRIFRDLTQAIVYVVVLLLTLRGIGVEPGSILTTSALLTAVIGLALQDTLGNMVSGLALQMQRPFEVGDWIQFDPDARQIGQVTEVNWRAITVVTNDYVEVIVPNAFLAKAPIRNYSKPSPVMRRSVVVQAPYGVPPTRVQEAIMAALPGTPGVVEEPSPWVQTKSFAESGVEYTVFFFTRAFAEREKTDGLVRDRVWFALQRAAITIPFPIRTVHMHAVTAETEQKDREKELGRRDRALRCVDFLDVLEPDVHRALAAAAQVRLYAPGEIVFRQGDRTTEFYIVDRGEVGVELTKDGETSTVARLGPGKFFGEMGTMTGQPRRATIRAATHCELLVIDHAAFRSTLAASPAVIEKMSDLLATRAAELEAMASARPVRPEGGGERAVRLISQIKGFFNL